MKIYINGKFLFQKTTGVQRVAKELLIQLNDICRPEDEITILIPSTFDDQELFTNFSFIVLKAQNLLFWEQFVLPKFVMKNKGFLVSLCNSAPIFLKKNIIFLHDISYIDNPKNYSLKFRLFYRFMERINIRKAKLCFTVSQFSKSRIISFYSFVDENKIKVIPNGFSYELLEKKEEPIKNLIKPFYFSIGSSSPNKNLDYIIKAAQSMPESLFVLSGTKNSNFKDRKNHEFPNNVLFLGYVSDNQLKWLYKNCEALVFPSFYEGFGLPPLEAISCGCNKIIVSDIPVLKEIYGAIGNFINPKKYIKEEFLGDKIISEEQKQELLTNYNYLESAKMLYSYLKETVR